MIEGQRGGGANKQWSEETIGRWGGDDRRGLTMQGG